MERAFHLAFTAAASPASVLLLGESGTGKSVLARAIHERSPQKDKAFVTISCPSLSGELLESELFGHVKGAFTGAVSDAWGKVAVADGGTLFLDEIGELPLGIQPKLLRLLQEKEYERVGESKTRCANVRIIAATNRDLETAVREKTFREDLFYRLNVIAIRVPPLRERPRDLKQMAADCLRFFSGQCGKRLTGFAPEAQAAFDRYRLAGQSARAPQRDRTRGDLRGRPDGRAPGFARTTQPARPAARWRRSPCRHADPPRTARERAYPPRPRANQHDGGSRANPRHLARHAVRAQKENERLAARTACSAPASF